jgi:filamentous hemagglutinin
LIASLSGDIILSAGNTYTQTGSDVHAYGQNAGNQHHAGNQQNTGNIYIRGQSVNIVEGRESVERVDRSSFEQTGLSLKLSHPAGLSHLKKLDIMSI